MGMYNIKNSKILLYGAGTNAHHLTVQLNTDSPVIVGYIDKRGDEIKEKNGLPVYCIDSLAKFDHKDEFVIVLTTRNVFEHSEIANLFIDMGFHRIIFKPYSLLKGRHDEVLSKISTIHDLISVQFKLPSYEIPEVLEMDRVTLKDNSIFSEEENNDFLKTYIPASLLFTNKIKGEFDSFLLSECNFMTNYVAVDLYKSFHQSSLELEEVIDRYIKFLCEPFTDFYNTDTTGEWRSLLIKARKDVYDQMCLTLELDYDFFKRNPTTVSFNENNNLGLIASGKNRVSFLIAKGFSHVPVKISREDYRKYINLPVVEELENYIQKEKMIGTFAPIPHPYFYELPSIAKDYVSLCISRLSYAMAYILLEKYHAFQFTALHIIDDMEDHGELARHFKRLGCQVSPRKKNTFTDLLNQLLPYEGTENVQTNPITLLLTMYDKQTFEIIEDYSKVDYLFLLQQESCDCFLIESKGYLLKKEIFSTYWDGKIVTGKLYEKG